MIKISKYCFYTDFFHPVYSKTRIGFFKKIVKNIFLEFAFVAQTLLNSGMLRPSIPIAVEDIEESVVCCKISRYF